MDLWVCSMYDCNSMHDTILGVYSTQELAEGNARAWAMDKGEDVELVDRSVGLDKELIYYKVIEHILGIVFENYYTATIEKFKLDADAF